MARVYTCEYYRYNGLIMNETIELSAEQEVGFRLQDTYVCFEL